MLPPPGDASHVCSLWEPENGLEDEHFLTHRFGDEGSREQHSASVLPQGHVSAEEPLGSFTTLHMLSSGTA